MKKMKSAQIWLGYYKQGRDFGQCLGEAKGDIMKAIKLHQEQMESVIAHLQGVADVLEETGTKGVEIDADTHMISITAPEKTINELVEKELAQLWDDDEEDGN